ncbi:YutD family protein [Chryseomicrobium palamuruense]|uniref:YutD family protein n=1 Tax=Chryseomicrobium palamuruense TaxID=682973 RepID=A0ABV8UWB2_9BACL
MHLEGYQYEVIEEFREGFNQEALETRYSDVLQKYDYIFGDWGYGQLRLRGFYEDKNSKSTFDTRISTIHDYILEYCNFGCAYFLLKKLGPIQIQEVPQEEVKPEAESQSLENVQPLTEETKENQAE